MKSRLTSGSGDMLSGALTIAVAAVSAVVAGSDPAHVTPRFAWPMTSSAALEVREHAEMSGGGVEIIKSCRLTVDPHPKGLVVACRDAEITGPWTQLEGAPREIREGFERLVPYALIASQFEWVVSRDGVFLGIANAAALLDGWRSAMGPQKPEGEALKKAESTVVAGAEAEARTTWNLLVGRWAGVDLELGRDYKSETILSVSEFGKSEPILSLAPVLGDRLRSAVTSRAERWVDCPGSEGARCIEFRTLGKMTPARQQDASADQGQVDAAEPGSSPAGAEKSIESETVLVADPTSLLPYSLMTRARIVGILPQAKPGAPQSGEATKTWKFSYAAPPSRHAPK